MTINTALSSQGNWRISTKHTKKPSNLGKVDTYSELVTNQIDAFIYNVANIGYAKTDWFLGITYCPLTVHNSSLRWGKEMTINTALRSQGNWRLSTKHTGCPKQKGGLTDLHIVQQFIQSILKTREKQIQIHNTHHLSFSCHILFYSRPFKSYCH